MDELVLLEEKPTVAELVALRGRMGWGQVEEADAARSIEAATYSVCLRHNGRLAGLARVMGDGVLYFHIAEMMVDAAFRSSGAGQRLMRAATGYIDRSARPGATVTLIPLRGMEPFYERFGFARCPDGVFGEGMHYTAAPPPAASR